MEKICRSCNARKEVTDENFRTRVLPNGSAWINTTCRECERKSNQEYHKNNRDKIRTRKKPVMAKWRKENAEHLANAGKARYQKYKEENPGFYLKDNLRSTMKKYGLTEEDYYILFEKQNGQCAICGSEGSPTGVDKNRLVVDHDHDSGMVRSLLCSKCNTGLGMFLDRSENIEKAAAYLREHGKLWVGYLTKILR